MRLYKPLDVSLVHPIAKSIRGSPPQTPFTHYMFSCWKLSVQYVLFVLLILIFSQSH